MPSGPVAVRALARARSAPRLASLALTAVAAALCAVPLFDLLGYEFCFALTLAQVPATFALVAARPTPPRLGARTLVRPLGQTTLVLLPPLAVVLANALRVQNCNLGQGLVAYATLVWASACYGTALATVTCVLLEPVATRRDPGAREASRGSARRRRVAVLVAVALAPLLASLARLYTEPPIAAYDHLWGYFAGSLYDEDVRLTSAFCAFRLSTLVRLLLCAAWLQHAHGPRARSARPWLAALTAWALAVGGDAALGPALGYRVDRAQLARVLPQTVACQGIVLHLPAELDAAGARLLAADHAFRLAQLQGRLGLEPRPRPLHSYVFASADDKARWTGGRHTMVAKPWLGEIYLHDTAAPHPVLAHELVHALLGPDGRAPLSVPWTGPWLPNMGLVEGAAEALAPAEGRPWDTAEVAACLWSEGGAARLTAAMGGRPSAGAPPFWVQSGPQAYAETGAFVDHLLRRYGARALRVAYARGDWRTAYGAPLDQLVAAYGSALTERHAQLDATSCAQIRATYLRPSVFGRVCAHEIARLQEAQRGATPAEALALQRQVVAHLPGNFRERVTLAVRLLATGNVADGAEATRLLDAEPAPNVTLAAEADEALAAAWARSGELGRAEHYAARGLSRQLRGAPARTLLVRQWSLTQPPPRRAAVDALLAGTCDPFRCGAALAEQNGPMAGYLLGRTLMARGQDADALRALHRAGPHPALAIEAERLRLLATLGWRARWAVRATGGQPAANGGVDTQGARDALAEALPALSRPAMPADARRLAAQLEERLRFEDAGGAAPCAGD